MNNRPYKSLILGIGTAIVATASYALISPKNAETDFNSTPLSIPAILPEPATPAIEQPVISSSETIAPELKTANPNANQISHKIKPGESISTIFSKLDLNKTDLHNIIRANELGKQFASIRPGKELLVSTDSNNQLKQLIYKKDSTDTLIATRTDDSFNVEIISKPVERTITSAQATINSSLYLDGIESGLSEGRIMELISIFAWDIDFALDVRHGDQFTVVYEKIYVDGKEILSGKNLSDNIISAEFVNQGNTYTAVRFKDKKGHTSYYTPEGKSMRKAFLRTPIAHARVSSHFNLKRKHPVLNRIRAHKGVDYAASTGTKIKSTGDGKIVFRGRKGGYGRVVIVQHGQKYSTLYAHMSNYRKGQKVGQHVKQGTVIGYVGKSGLATGPHLHYEFRVNSVHRNPLTVKLPNTQPIKKSLLAEFKKQTQPLLAQLNKAKASTLLAQNKH